MLTLERQTSSSIEHFGEKEICVVVKQSIFTLTITSPQRIEGIISCELVYDLDDFIPVGFVSQNPLTYKVNVITSNTINIECKLAVLSSKHEDLLFRVHVKQTNGDTLISSLYSKPIRSTSKADSHRKGKQQNGQVVEIKREVETKPKARGSRRTPSSVKRSCRNVVVMGSLSGSQSQEVENITAEQRMMEIRLMRMNRQLIEKLKSNLSHQNEKTKTLQGSVEELALRLAQYDFTQHVQLVYDVSTLFTSDQLEVLQEISSILQSACPMQNNRANALTSGLGSHLQNPTQQTYNPYREVVNVFMAPNDAEAYL